jgi:acetoacetyl-CoA reductase
MGGLGQEIARALHDAGHQVLVTHSRSEADAQVWLKEQADAGYVFQGYHVDVADFESCQQMAQAIEKDGLQVDILVNNAGITRDGTFRKLSKDKWDDVLRVNLDSVFNVTKPFIDGMLERTWGRVINISSINGSKGAVRSNQLLGRQGRDARFHQGLGSGGGAQGRDRKHNFPRLSGHQNGHGRA